MWTANNRAQQDQSQLRYPNDLTDGRQSNL